MHADTQCNAYLFTQVLVNYLTFGHPLFKDFGDLDSRDHSVKFEKNAKNSSDCILAQTKFWNFMVFHVKFNM